MVHKAEQHIAEVDKTVADTFIVSDYSSLDLLRTFQFLSQTNRGVAKVSLETADYAVNHHMSPAESAIFGIIIGLQLGAQSREVQELHTTLELEIAPDTPAA